MAEATDFAGGGPAEELLDQLLSEPGAQRALVDGSPAVRTESRSAGTDDESGVELSARQVVYTVGGAAEFAGAGPTEDVLIELLKQPDSSAVVIDGVIGVRSDRSAVEQDVESGLDVPARQVAYAVPIPDAGQWLLVVFDVVRGEHETEDYAVFADALVDLFDAVMTTFRWQFE